MAEKRKPILRLHVQILRSETDPEKPGAKNVVELFEAREWGGPRGFYRVRTNGVWLKRRRDGAATKEAATMNLWQFRDVFFRTVGKRLRERQK